MKRNIILGLLEKAGLTGEVINSLAVETGLIKRSRKIKALDFLLCLITESVCGCVSCNDLAAAIEFEAGLPVSRQAYHRKMNDASVNFFEEILAAVLDAKTDVTSEFTRFKRIILQDSTLLKLPLKLMGIFSGVKNRYKHVCNARIQCVYDLLSGSFRQWSLDSYSKNDFVAADELQVSPGELVLRDRGYFTIDESRRIMQAEADFISRYKYKTLIYHPETGKKINMFELLKSQRNVDMQVLIGSKDPLEVRFIAAEVSQEIASRRRQKAKKECKGHHPCKEILFLMGWTLFFTSITCRKLDINDFIELYSQRWRIENIFKTWKSNFNFDRIHNVGEKQLRLIMIARFIAIALFYERIYIPLSERMAAKSNKQLSLMKLMRYISRNIMAIPQLLKAVTGSIKNLQIVERYCSYDKRKRLNFEERKYRILATAEAIKSLS